MSMSSRMRFVGRLAMYCTVLFEIKFLVISIEIIASELKLMRAAGLIIAFS
jgi:hypothetical protein